jgi:tRNA-Thr(GGU) m(6)t(6)A37 methyltransferase TsaA
MQIDLDPAFLKGLAGISSGDHLWVLYWMHELPPGERRRLQTHPRGDRTRPKQGVFALHSPCRPNPIGMTRVRVLKVEKSKVLVDGLDAHNGSPILDIKSG